MKLRKTFKQNKDSVQGQASIMIALMTLTFVLFFIFVVNTGILVSAKINLQNAADLAAYAGASVQARQLNAISYLNYEMRRQFKKFLFRYYVLGTRAQAPQKSSSLQRIWSPNGEQSSDFKVPAVCVIFKKESNHCQVPALRPIEIPPQNPLDSISVALAEQLKNLEKIRQDQCKYSWFTNQLLLTLWLFNSDPELNEIRNNLQSASDVETRLVLETVQGLARGLGLIPRELLLLQRIQTLRDYVNFPAQIDLTLEDIQRLKAERDQAKRERTIQAYMSAYYTLGAGGDPQTDTFPGDKIRLTELLPGTTNQADLLKLNTIRSGFETYYVYFKLDGAETSKPCLPKPVPVKIRNLPLGVSKDPNVLTYYAVKLEAEANLLFKGSLFRKLPFGLKLRAYSAAQPFGSRIGPDDPNGDSFVKKNVINCSNVQNCIGVPNLTLSSKVPLGGVIADYHSVQVLEAFDKTIRVQDDKIRIDDQDYWRAMVPFPSEEGKYNMINDFPYTENDLTHREAGNPFIKFFPEGKVYSLWAPITSPELSQDQAERVIQQMIDENLSSDTGDTTDNQKIEALKKNSKRKSEILH